MQPLPTVAENTARDDVSPAGHTHAKSATDAIFMRLIQVTGDPAIRNVLRHVLAVRDHDLEPAALGAPSAVEHADYRCDQSAGWGSPLGPGAGPRHG